MAADNLDKGEAVKVLGSGCAKCNKLETNVKIALEQLGMDTAIEHIKYNLTVEKRYDTL